MLAIVSVLSPDASEPVFEPAYSVTDPTDRDRSESKEAIDRLPDSSRTRNCEIDGFGGEVNCDDNGGVESPVIWIEGVGRSDRIS